MAACTLGRCSHPRVAPHAALGAGRVLVDGRDVGAYCPKWLRRRMALVSQEPVLYGRSIRRNIIYGLGGRLLRPALGLLRALLGPCLAAAPCGEGVG